jgi:hypothetical protein
VTSPVQRVASLAERHRGFLGLLLIHAVVYWATLTGGSPFATASVECAAGGMADAVLAGDRAWSAFDTFDGPLGGMFVAAMAGLPLFAVGGVTAFTTKAVAWGFAVAVLVVVYALLDRHESRPAALLGVATLGFGPPALWSVSMVFGNWHWTELLFDYGVALGALELLRAHRSGRPGVAPWLLLGAITGLGLFNSFGSVPFMGATWGVLVVGLLSRRLLPVGPLALRVATAAGGVLVGAAPFLYKAFVHAPYGAVTHAGGGLPSRLRFGFDASKVLDLLSPPMAWALHVQDFLPRLVEPALWAMAGSWLAVTWAGVVVALVLTRRRMAAGEAVLGGLAPVLFVFVFVAAYAVVGMRIETLIPEFSNLRETTHRPLPPIIAALAVGSAVGWTRLWSVVRGTRTARVVAAVAVIPFAVGLATSVAGTLGTVGAGRAELGVYRASCFDVGGFFAAPWFGEPRDLQQQCAQWGEADRVAECRIGAAWGAGYYGNRQSSERCHVLPTDLRGHCLRGIGWGVGEQGWGRVDWPATDCDLVAEPDRAGCWRGVGFLLGDHLHGTPWRMEAAIRRAPAEWQADVAQGAGYTTGRTYSSAPFPVALCEQLNGELEQPCLAGVAEAHPEVQR